ncbi:macrophage-expressed gene 1 protein-like [Sardina pilchardus]|uniref:macrophage-expressed gene 1 protein-like n=1 Tax=Sardina pilchardus TaxID=27697 RepID=UPI002E0D44D5
MDSRLVCLILFAVIHNSCSGPHPSNGLRECRKTLSPLKVLPGGGWDNLRNWDMGRVMNFSYSQCRTTEDGVYLIPDEVFVIPQKITTVERSSDVFEHWLNHTSSTSQTINADASFLSELNGKFSSDSQRTKTYQVRDKAVISRSQVRNRMYTVDTYPDFTLDSRFIEQVKEIADALLKNNTRRATFLSEMMVVDYGTHVITSVDAGAILEQEDYVESNYYYYNTTEKTQLSNTAGLNFFKIIKFDMDTKESRESSETISYKTHLTHSLTQSHGGPVFYPGITLKTWQESTLNNLVFIDRSGLPLHYILNRATLPDLPDTIIESVAQSVHNAIQLYYDVNKRPGCLDRSSANLNFQANVDDNSCLGQATGGFGGIYQICTPLTPDAALACVGQNQTNPATRAYSCGEPYLPTLLQSAVIEKQYSYTECHDDCESLCLFDCCKTVCNTLVSVRRAKVMTYWCATDKFNRSVYLFGGLYSPNVENPLTRSKSCPPNFSPRTFLSNGFKICLSNGYGMASSYSVPFGGFFSCMASNPLASSDSRCPPQFSQHLVTIDDGCQILYCVKSGAFTGGQLKPINLPPFTHPELIRKVDNKTMIMVTEGDQVWLRRGNSNSWHRAESWEVAKYVRQLHTSEGGQITAGFLVTFPIILAIGERTHIFVNKNLKQAEAQTYCQRHHDTLSSILTQDDHQKLQSLNHTGPSWIGLSRGLDWTWTDGSKPTFYNWRRLEMCAVVTTDRLWESEDCSKGLPSICQTNQGQHNPVQQEKTWEEAKTHCEDRGHKLATFKSASAKPSQWPDNPHWIGLRRRDAGWSWVDEDGGGGLSYSNWKTLRFCGLMHPDGEWRDEMCHEKYPFVCADGADEQSYHLNTPRLSWHEAKQECQKKSMHLVTIHDASQNTILRNKFNDEFWIGLSINSWKWPDGCSAELQYWGDKEPNGLTRGETCVLMRNGQWNDVICSQSHPFFCLMRPQEKLKVLRAPSGWEEALLHCRGLGGDLASIGNRDNQMLIQQVVHAAVTTHVWVGLRFLAGEWLWLSGEGPEYQHWAPATGQEICPLHHCGAIERNTGHWVPRGCEEELDFLCQLP